MIVLVVLAVGAGIAIVDVAADEFVLPRLKDRPARPWAFYIWLAVMAWVAWRLS